MDKLLFVLLISFGVLSLHTNSSASTANHQTTIASKKINLASTHFKCDGRQYCSQMTSRAEAEYFINNCPDTKMDGDQDGIPCENDSRF